MIDDVTPKGKWKFNSEVAKCFADMLERSIPDYKSMRSLVFEIGEKYIQPGTWLVDVGCSTGLATEPFFSKHQNELKYYLCDNSTDMLAECAEKLKKGMIENRVIFSNADFWNTDMPDNTSLCLSILSMQFMPTAYRQSMINTIYERLTSGGAFIFVEKIIGGERMDDALIDLYYQMKRANGYTDEKIMKKRKSLENVLSPLKAEWNEDMLHEAGFEEVEMFWRCLNFCGWVAVK